jgi:hypothetical protein
MRQLTKSMASFAWAAALLGMRQAGNLFDVRTWMGSDGAANRDLNVVSSAIAKQLGGDSVRQAFDAGDRLQSGMIDALFGLMWPFNLLRADSGGAPLNNSVGVSGEYIRPPQRSATGYSTRNVGSNSGSSQSTAQSLGVPFGVPPVYLRRRGVTGISTGGVTDPGNTYTDEAGLVHVTKQLVAGPVWLNHDGFKTEGTEYFEINGSLDKDYSGIVWGAFTLSMKDRGTETIIWDGHWAGTLVKKIGQSMMIARGRGPFTGKALFLYMKEIEPTDVNPDPNVYVLDGYMAEEESTLTAGGPGIAA